MVDRRCAVGHGEFQGWRPRPLNSGRSEASAWLRHVDAGSDSGFIRSAGPIARPYPGGRVRARAARHIRRGRIHSGPSRHRRVRLRRMRRPGVRDRHEQTRDEGDGGPGRRADRAVALLRSRRSRSRSVVGSRAANSRWRCIRLARDCQAVQSRLERRRHGRGIGRRVARPAC